MNKRNKPASNAKRKSRRLKVSHLAPDVQSMLREAINKFESGDIVLAFALAKKAAKISKEHPAALNLLGAFYLRNKDHNAAILFFKKVLIKAPDDLLTQSNLAEAFCAVGQFTDAIQIYEGILQGESQNVNDLVNFGTALMGVGEPERAVKVLSKALKEAPESLTILSNLALLAKQLGQKDETLRLLRGALEVYPNNGEVYYNIAMSKKFSGGDPDIINMEEVKRVAPVGTENRMFLGYALGKAYEDCKDFDSAITNLTEANRFWRGQIKYNVATDLEKFSRIEQIFSKELLLKYDEFGFVNSDKVPIFIVGMPRSGTTLVEQILSAHTKVFGSGELPLLQTLAFNYQLKNGQNTNSRNEVSAFPEYLETLEAKKISKLGQKYLQGLPDASKEFLFITDKMPSNFQLVGLIRLILPNAKVIHCRRSPLDTCLSCYALHFPYGQEFSYNLKELALYYKGYNKLMRHWNGVLGDWYISVSYENLIESSEYETRQILEFCGLNWEDKCLEFYNSKRRVESASAVQVRQPIYKSAVNRWRNFERHLDELIEELGPLVHLP